MNAKRLIVIGLAVQWHILSAMGQSAPAAAVAPLPSGPLLRQATNFSAWQINYRYPGDPEKPGAAAAPSGPAASNSVSFAAPRRITIIRTYPVWRAVFQNVDGALVDEWSDGRMQYFQTSEQAPGQLMTRDGSGVPTFPDFSKKGFPDMDWISASTYAGAQMIGSRKCLVFKKDDMIAWTDLQSRYPVRWQHGEEVREFVELASPVAVLQLPPKIQAVADAVKHDAEKLSQPPPPGG